MVLSRKYKFVYKKWIIKIVRTNFVSDFSFYIFISEFHAEFKNETQNYCNILFYTTL